MYCFPHLGLPDNKDRKDTPIPVVTELKKKTELKKETELDKKTKQSTQEDLFDFIATCVADFIKEKNITSKLPLGFTFSFPVHQTSLTSGTLVRWTKDFTASGAVGNDPVKMLQDAFQRKGVSTCQLVYGYVLALFGHVWCLIL